MRLLAVPPPSFAMKAKKKNPPWWEPVTIRPRPHPKVCGQDGPKSSWPVRHPRRDVGRSMGAALLQNLLFLFALVLVCVFVLRFVSAIMDEFFAPHGALLN